MRLASALLLLAALCLATRPALATPRALQQSKCDKCNIPVNQGGCKCNSNCDCIAAADKCAKCNLPAAQGGCKCNSNCDCITSGGGGGSIDKCAKCNLPAAQGGCKCNSNCDCITSGGGGGGGGGGGLGTVRATYHLYGGPGAPVQYDMRYNYCADRLGGYSQAWQRQYPWTAYCAPAQPMSQDMCGRCLRVTNTRTGQSQVVRIVDQCSNGGLDLDYQTAFKPLDGDGAGYQAGQMTVSIALVSC